jgi:hypothetical protein
MNSFNALRNHKLSPWAAHILALLGLSVYLVQAVLFAHTTGSNLDEGGYLYKGLLFAEGVYRPFQPYGFWTNKAPLAFLIPGYVQEIFGAGLRTGRYLAIAESILAIIGLWIVTRRLAGKWLAAAAVWVLALSPVVIKVYSVGASQSLVAFFIAWILALSLGPNRPLWQLILSAVLASLMILARQNMIIVLPLLMLYIFWEHGWKAAAWASLAGGSIFIIGHVIYWPEIIQIWIDWLPFYPAEWRVHRVPGGGEAIWNPSISLASRILSVFQGFRWHFVVLAGGLLSLLLWPRREKLSETSVFRSAVFLTVLFLGLLYLHSSASLERNYCVFCFAPYLSFFNIVGIVMVCVFLQSWNKNPPKYIQVLIIILVLFIAAGTGFATFEDTGKWLLNFPAPRFSNGWFQPGFTTVGETLFNKFALDPNTAKRVAATGLGLAVISFIYAASYLLNLRLKYNYGYFLANVSLLCGLFISPLMAGAQGALECDQDVILANEQIGAYLAEVIPENSSVYWHGGLSVVPLLYAPEAKIYPPQVNDGYGFRNGGNADALLKYGLWNDELSQRWKNEADIIIIEEWRYSGWKSFLTADRFEELPRTPASTSCMDGTRLRIFKRIQ